MDTEKVKQNPAVEAAGSSGGQAARIFKKENIPKTAETVGRDTFEEWMGRIMERFDRQDRIISVLVNKDAAGVKYLDGERLYDNQDLCEMLRTSKRSLQRFRSKYRLRYQRIGHKTYYKESDVLEFISQNMEEVLQGGTKVLRMKEQPGMEAPCSRFLFPVLAMTICKKMLQNFVSVGQMIIFALQTITHEYNQYRRHTQTGLRR